MKKNTFVIAVMAAMVLSSCSNQEEIYPDLGPVKNNPNAISFMGTTTRANISTMTQLEEGFQVFASTDGTNWYKDATGTLTTINGTFDYYKPAGADPLFSDFNGWQWRNEALSDEIEAPIWPTFGGGTTMEFYAKHPIENSFTPGPGDMTKTIVPDADRFKQVDELAARATVNARPANGLALHFNHILSKINVSIAPGAGLTVEVQSVKLVKPLSEAKYDYATATTAAAQVGWAATTTTGIYGYNESVFAGSTTAGANAYMATHTSGAAVKSLMQNNGTVDGNLMLIPQVHTATDLTDVKTNANIITGGSSPYFEVIYRVYETTGGKDVVGRSDIKGVSVSKPYYNVDGTVSYKDYITDVVATAWSGSDVYPGYAAPGADYINSGVPQDDEHLYIKALFPIMTTNPDAGVAWDRGKGYTYNLLIGGDTGTGGYYADNEYYDETGRGTGLYHRGTNGDGGDPVFSNYIHFDVTVGDWDDTTPDTEIGQNP